MVHPVVDKQKLFTFEINGDTWTVNLVNFIDNTLDIFGQTKFETLEVLLRKDLPASLIRKTLIHEVTHVWLYESGHDPNQEAFTDEDICCVTANAYDFINSILKEAEKDDKSHHNI